MKRGLVGLGGILWKCALIVFVVLLIRNSLNGEVVLQRLPGPPGGDGANSAYAVSNDGSVVVGQGYTAQGTEAIVWRNGVPTALGDLPGGIHLSVAFDVSGDGSVIAGYGNSGLGRQAIKWENDVLVPLSDIGGGNFECGALGVSEDGATLVGFGTNYNNNYHAARWVDAQVENQVEDLGDLYTGTGRSYAWGVSPTGNVIVGWASFGSGQVAFRYSESTMTPLPDLEGGIDTSWATDVTDDGTMIVGRGSTQQTQEAVYWVDDEVHSLGDIPEIPVASEALAVSGDGSIIVGYGTENYLRHAVMWLEADGYVPIKLDEYVDSVGVNREGFSMREAHGISKDGRVIVGFGAVEGESQEPFALHLGEAEKWGPYVISDGYVDTTPWLGVLYVEFSPWVWSVDMESWYWIPGESVESGSGWIFIPIR